VVISCFVHTAELADLWRFLALFKNKKSTLLKSACLSVVLKHHSEGHCDANCNFRCDVEHLISSKTKIYCLSVVDA
jgi:hypothetical protein